MSPGLLILKADLFPELHTKLFPTFLFVYIVPLSGLPLSPDSITLFMRNSALSSDSTLPRIILSLTWPLAKFF